MVKHYDPSKRFKGICDNPLKLTISYEDGFGRYILTDATKTYGRVLDTNVSALYDTKYVVSIFRINSGWHRYVGEQTKLKELLMKVKYIWNNSSQINNLPKDFKIEDYK